MFCRNCGEELLPEDRFCGHCGKQVVVRSRAQRSDDAGDAQPQPSQPTSPEAPVEPVPARLRTTQSTAQVFSTPMMTSTPMTARPLGPAGLRSFPAAHRPTEEPVEEREPAERIQAEPQQPFTFEAPPRNEVSDEPAARSWLAEPQRATADEASEPAPEPQLYMYDPTGGAPSSSRRGLLIAVIILLLVGIAGVFYLMNSSPKKTAPTKSSSSNIGVTLTPSTAELEPGNAIDLTATVTNGNGTEVGWVVEEGNTAGQIVPRGAEMQGDGSIQLKAVYVAPQQTGTYHVTVTSKADDSKSAQSVIKVARKQ